MNNFIRVSVATTNIGFNDKKCIFTLNAINKNNQEYAEADTTNYLDIGNNQYVKNYSLKNDYLILISVKTGIVENEQTAWIIPVNKIPKNSKYIKINLKDDYLSQYREDWSVFK